jgi:hypothetical protein
MAAWGLENEGRDKGKIQWPGEGKGRIIDKIGASIIRYFPLF